MTINMESWNGLISNQQIIAKTNKIKETIQEIHLLESEIKKIQKHCEHEFVKTHDGEYDNIHKCIHCGFEIET